MICGVIISSGDQKLTLFYKEMAKTAGGKDFNMKKLSEENFIDFLLSSRHSPLHFRAGAAPSSPEAVNATSMTFSGGALIDETGKNGATITKK